MFENRKERAKQKKKEKMLHEIAQEKMKYTNQKYQADAEARRKKREADDLNHKIIENQKRYLTCSEMELPQVTKDTLRYKREMKLRQFIIEHYNNLMEMADKNVVLTELKEFEAKNGVNEQTEKQIDEQNSQLNDLINRDRQTMDHVNDVQRQISDGIYSTDESDMELEAAKKMRSSGLNPLGTTDTSTKTISDSATNDKTNKTGENLY